MEKLVCRYCLDRQTCIDKRPINIRGKIPSKYVDCLRFTCPAGERAARSATHSGNITSFESAEGTIIGYRFGSEHKPTHKARRFGRYVDPEGEIYFQDGDNPAGKTGRNIFPWKRKR